MTIDDILRIAKESGMELYTRHATFISTSYSIDNLQQFANLVATAEREACAELVSKLGDNEDDGALFRVLKDAAIAIRARGQECN